MLAPLSWLSEYAPFGVDPLDRAAVRALGGTVDSLGLVIEGIAFIGEGLEDIVLARVQSIRPIENADRVRLVVAGVPQGAVTALGDVVGGPGDLRAQLFGLRVKYGAHPLELRGGPGLFPCPHRKPSIHGEKAYLRFQLR